METSNKGFRVERFETKTGIRLKSTGEIYREDDSEPGILFSDEEEAKKYVRTNLKPGLEFIVYDSQEKVIYQHVCDVVYIEKKWWKFWR